MGTCSYCRARIEMTRATCPQCGGPQGSDGKATVLRDHGLEGMNPYFQRAVLDMRPGAINVFPSDYERIEHNYLQLFTMFKKSLNPPTIRYDVGAG